VEVTALAPLTREVMHGILSGFPVALGYGGRASGAARMLAAFAKYAATQPEFQPAIAYQAVSHNID
jgi:F0F1-type ATP synthase membrane subunit c/vacuolar-type H+-ATPase subunit K